jgi:hypothetical protein
MQAAAAAVWLDARVAGAAKGLLFASLQGTYARPSLLQRVQSMR